MDATIIRYYEEEIDENINLSRKKCHKHPHIFQAINLLPLKFIIISFNLQRMQRLLYLTRSVISPQGRSLETSFPALKNEETELKSQENDETEQQKSVK